MIKLVNLKSRLKQDDVLRLLALSVYNPTPERLESRVDGYITDNSAYALAIKRKGAVVGLAVFKVEGKTATVLDIAVASELRNNGLGSRLLKAIAKRYDVTQITAETDTQAVVFYEKCGFSIIEAQSNYDVKRYMCTKTVKGKIRERLNIGLKIALLTVGAILILNGIFVSAFSSAIMAIVSTLIAGVTFFLIGLFYKFVRFKVHMFFKLLFSLFVITVASVIGFVYIYGLTDTVTYKEDAIVVLGAGLHGDQLSKTLKNRLNTALEYHRKNPDAVIVVTGGQGLGETVTEGYAMEKYLIENGVPEDKILREEASTSTEENFRFAKVLLDERFKREYSIAYVTSDFHIYRAGFKAEFEGYKGLTHIHSTADITSFFPNGLREFLAVAHLWVFE